MAVGSVAVAGYTHEAEVGHVLVEGHHVLEVEATGGSVAELVVGREREVTIAVGV